MSGALLGHGGTLWQEDGEFFISFLDLWCILTRSLDPYAEHAYLFNLPPSCTATTDGTVSRAQKEHTVPATTHRRCRSLTGGATTQTR